MSLPTTEIFNAIATKLLETFPYSNEIEDESLEELLEEAEHFVRTVKEEIVVRGIKDANPS